MAAAPHVLIVEARYYDKITDELVRGAEAALQQAGATSERVTVPGAFEIPTAIGFARRAAKPGGGPRFDGFVALGCVIRGETSHYDYVCGESARKLQDLACDHDLALGYGILTCETGDQAWERARMDGRNKGGEAAGACLAMLALKRAYDVGQG
jgi:6,7-dimethyl-8-ribityllumazine synthase